MAASATSARDVSTEMGVRTPAVRIAAMTGTTLRAVIGYCLLMNRPF
jgi:hypothetical protein